MSNCDDGDPHGYRKACRGVFEQLKIIGGKRFARRVFKNGLTIDYDSKNWMFMPAEWIEMLLTRLEDAKLILNALVEEGVFKRRGRR